MGYHERELDISNFITIADMEFISQHFMEGFIK